MWSVLDFIIVGMETDKIMKVVEKTVHDYWISILSRLIENILLLEKSNFTKEQVVDLIKIYKLETEALWLWYKVG